mmetsp:Transcript_36901/g.85115  ORF Transcript_36901/g.85115 Transcript_36901/m.85115 type:complete len:254 (-) Transcript_36901:2240-3001(-)
MSHRTLLVEPGCPRQSMGGAQRIHSVSASFPAPFVDTSDGQQDSGQDRQPSHNNCWNSNATEDCVCERVCRDSHHEAQRCAQRSGSSVRTVQRPNGHAMSPMPGHAPSSSGRHSYIDRLRPIAGILPCTSTAHYSIIGIHPYSALHVHGSQNHTLVCADQGSAFRDLRNPRQCWQQRLHIQRDSENRCTSRQSRCCGVPEYPCYQRYSTSPAEGVATLQMVSLFNDHWAEPNSREHLDHICRGIQRHTTLEPG